MKIPNYEKNKKDNKRALNEFLSEEYRMLLCGQNGCGKTNVVMKFMLRKPLLYYDKYYFSIPNQQLTVEDGSSNVGKSRLVCRYLSRSFHDAPTIGAVFYTIEVSLDSEKNANLHSWDTGGLEEYRSFPPMLYHGSDAAIVVYDVTWRASFEDAKKWVDDFIEVSEPGAFVALVGNKVDLEEKRVVSYER
ncbi:ras-related protein Rab-5B-like [Stylophora pistillata]|uniref:ras-related protein Rab-5B-like n=1 Tax=Stylophora pistillata TaxID=50429 RepID=UPI000C0395FF|nr:ras-related protein Rab-5B-like [Stylophora pistillata]